MTANSGYSDKRTRAFIEDYNRVVIIVPSAWGATRDEFKVYGGGVEIPITDFYCNPHGGHEITLVLGRQLDPEQPCFVVRSGISVPAQPKGIYDTAEFAARYTYDGKLGASIEGGKTVFRLWAPFAQSVRLNIYGDGETGSNYYGGVMRRGERGVWTATLDDDLSGKYYTYTLSYNGREDAETVDPYAISGGMNAGRGMIVDTSSPRLTPYGWAEEHEAYKKKHPLRSYTDAVIWETHIRDFSGKTRAINRTRFLALAEHGLRNGSGETIGLDYLADLGITHVHLLPVAQYATVDETRLYDETYNAFNWGYDPKHFNMPMGAYCTNPRDGNSRVRDLREAVCALHSSGIGVVFDVVYNHTYNFEAPLALTVPYYYYRFDHRGNPSNGSGCGNETASERPMCRKFIIDSLLHWARTYHADGFRFDLMGLHDVETMQAIERALHAENPDILLYGEGWVGGSTLLAGKKQCNKWNCCGITRSEGAAGSIAVFSDVMRDCVKGSVFHGGDGGYVNGRPYENVNAVKFSSMGATSPNFNMNWVPDDAGRVINYVSAHDNNTLWDKIAMTSGHAPRELKLRINRMCAGIVMTSRGIPFFQSGEELLRSKPNGSGGFVENSYNSPDEINNIDWDALVPGSDTEAMRDYYKGLIAFRKAHPVLRLSGRAEIEEATDFRSDVRYDIIAYTLRSADEELYIVYDPLEPADVPLPEGKWSLRIDGERAGDADLGIYEGKYHIEGKSVCAFVRVR